MKEKEPLNPIAIFTNNGIIDYCRTSVSCIGGTAAGILGLTGFRGFLFYMVASLFLSPEKTGISTFNHPRKFGLMASLADYLPMSYFGRILSILKPNDT
ncbi:ER membrane protein complex subunit 6 [Trichoplax sp. H2]|nr:ER membrane protein complex subunit 6 [Trichoplax sp. H2]|eukprot:RDD39246.1 ER membrane protein complex subunit 6 [Trichoplax sp. H2]